MALAAALPGHDERAAAATAAAAARDGDESAFAALVHRFAPRLHRYLAAMGLPGADAEDLVQEAFLRAWRHLGDYDPRWAFSTWLWTIARRLALNHLARRRPAPLEGSEPEAPAGASGEPGAVQDLWNLARARLPERQCTALWLRYGEERPLEEVAAILSVSPINARVLVHRARQRLAQALGLERSAADTADEEEP
jgi:RNA polymerase sigma-70 factor (ECF subfamily)